MQGGSVQSQRYTGRYRSHRYRYISRYIGHLGARWFCTSLNDTQVEIYLTCTGTRTLGVQVVLYSLNSTHDQVYLTYKRKFVVVFLRRKFFQISFYLLLCL